MFISYDLNFHSIPCLVNFIFLVFYSKKLLYVFLMVNAKRVVANLDVNHIGASEYRLEGS